jgi:hypothetical protein
MPHGHITPVSPSEAEYRIGRTVKDQHRRLYVTLRGSAICQARFIAASQPASSTKTSVSGPFATDLHVTARFDLTGILMQNRFGGSQYYRAIANPGLCVSGAGQETDRRPYFDAAPQVNDRRIRRSFLDLQGGNRERSQAGRGSDGQVF